MWLTVTGVSRWLDSHAIVWDSATVRTLMDCAWDEAKPSAGPFWYSRATLSVANMSYIAETKVILSTLSDDRRCRDIELKVRTI